MYQMHTSILNLSVSYKRATSNNSSVTDSNLTDSGMTNCNLTANSNLTNSSPTDCSATISNLADPSLTNPSLTDCSMTDPRVVATTSKVSNAPQLKTPRSKLSCVWSTASNRQPLGTCVTYDKPVQHVQLV